MEALSLPLVPRNATEELRVQLAERGKRDLYFFAKAVLGYSKLTPRTHGSLCRFLDTCDYARRIIHMPRGHYKTTICTIAQAIRRIVLDPDIRILIVAGTSTNAERFLIEIRKHFENNQMFQWLYPEVIPDDFSKTRWNNKELEVKRKAQWREPTVDSIGDRGMVESRHYEYIIADDIIGRKEYESESEMQKTIGWAFGLESLLVNPRCQIDFVGSRWKMDDVYAALETFYSHDEAPVEIGPYAYTRGEVAVFVRSDMEDGKPIFPEEFSASFFARLMQRDPEYYAAQYANNPRAPGIATFREEWLRFYRGDPVSEILELRDSDGKLLDSIDPWSMDRIVCYDPSVAETSSSARHAMLVLGLAGRRVMVLEAVIGHFPPHEAIERIFELDRRWQPRIFSIERFGFQGWIKYWLEQRAAETFRPVPPIVEYPPKGSLDSRRAKDERIKALQPWFREGLIWVHESMTELIEEYIYYPRGKFCDALDALAQGLDYWRDVWSEKETQDFRAREEAILSRLDSTGYGLRRDLQHLEA